jgi:hypothetical protein
MVLFEYEEPPLLLPERSRSFLVCLILRSFTIWGEGRLRNEAIKITGFLATPAIVVCTPDYYNIPIFAPFPSGQGDSISTQGSTGAGGLYLTFRIPSAACAPIGSQQQPSKLGF